MFLELVLLMAIAEPPATMVLRKCVAPGGATRYQTAPCGEGDTEAWSQPVQPEPPRPAARPSGQAAPTRPATARAPRAASPRASAREARRQRCERARREADEQRDRFWNRLTFDQRSALDAKVARACRD